MLLWKNLIMFWSNGCKKMACLYFLFNLKLLQRSLPNFLEPLDHLSIRGFDGKIFNGNSVRFSGVTDRLWVWGAYIPWTAKKETCTKLTALLHYCSGFPCLKWRPDFFAADIPPPPSHTGCLVHLHRISKIYWYPCHPFFCISVQGMSVA